MKKINWILKSAFAISIVFYSCGGGKTSDEQADSVTATADTTPVNEVASFRFTFTIANLPSPLMVLDEFAKSNLPTDLSLLNPVENANNYHNSFKQALNYG